MTEPIEVMEHLVTLTYHEELPPNTVRFGEALLDGRIIGQKCPTCGRVYLPPKDFCPLDVIVLGPENDVEVADHGVVTGFTIITPVRYYGQTKTEPFIFASVLLDGADATLGGQDISGLPAESVRVGLARQGGVEAQGRAGLGGHVNPRLGERRRFDRLLRGDRRAGHAPGTLPGARPLMAATDIAIVGWSQTKLVSRAVLSEPQLCLQAITGAIASSGVNLRDIGFTCSGSCDYLSGGPFVFVANLEAAGAWPPIAESHVEMDGAWALYEAWVRLHEGDIDTALVFGSGKSSPSNAAELYPQQLDPYYLAPLGLDPNSMAGHAGPDPARLGPGHRTGFRRGGVAQPSQRQVQSERGGERRLRHRRSAGGRVRVGPLARS